MPGRCSGEAACTRRAGRLRSRSGSRVRRARPEAKQEGLAALERARGESAALRNLANAARAMENNPNLSYLRLLQTIEKNGGSSMFVLPPALGELVRPVQAKAKHQPPDESTD